MRMPNKLLLITILFFYSFSVSSQTRFIIIGISHHVFSFAQLFLILSALIQGYSIVINYDIPKYKDVYIHRIGRSGRFGRKGVAINFVTQDDIKKLRMIQEYYQTEILEMPENLSEFL